MPAPPDLVAHKPHFHRNEAWKQPVRCATTAAGTLATSFVAGQTVDGVTLATGDRILVKDQAAAAENGIRVVAASGAPARAFDMDVAAEVVGAQVYVVEGTVNAGLVFRSTNATTPTLETTALTFALPTGSGGGDTVGQFIVGWDGGGSAITAGTIVDVLAPFTGTITGWTLLADASGSAVVDIWKDVYANFPPTVADTITASAKPTLTSATKATSSTLTGWTTAVTAGDILRFNLDSASTITRLLLVLDYTRP